MPALRRLSRPGHGLAGLLGLLVIVAVAACATTQPDSSNATVPPSVAAPSPVVAATVVASLGLDPDSGLPVVALAALPPEATQVMTLIGTGGPFPYPQDGAVFENREGILPDADVSYYHEYTVPTPGSPDRGARRIVLANQGEAYWTDDHYASFWRIAP